MITVNINYFSYLKALYQKASYLPQVTVSECFSRDKMADHKTAQTAKGLFRGVMEYFAEPLSYYASESQKIGQTLERNGFVQLGTKVFSLGERSYYSVLEHPNLPGKVIKHATLNSQEGTMEGPDSFHGDVCLFTEHSSMLRIARLEQLKAAAKALKMEELFLFPEKKFVTLPGKENEPDPFKRYCLIAQKINVMSADESRESIKKLPETKQKQLADNLASFIEKSGYADINFRNIRFTKDGTKIVILDTEATRETILATNIFTRLFGWQSSIEKSARVGLTNLYQSAMLGGKTAFATRLGERYHLAAQYQFSYDKGLGHLVAFGLEYAFAGQYKVPILVLTALLPFVVAGIEYGADRYLSSKMITSDNSDWYANWRLYLRDGVKGSLQN